MPPDDVPYMCIFVRPVSFWITGIAAFRSSTPLAMSELLPELPE